MAYRDFTLRRVRDEFGLKLDDSGDLFARVEPVEVGTELAGLLEEQVPLASAISTDKARAELVTAPILLEARRQTGRRIGFFSGIDFDVDPSLGLDGSCDFLLTKSPRQFIIQAPILAVIEAKNENIIAGLGPCAAEMVAARMFNAREAEPIGKIFGAVTTGTAWRFLRLDGASLAIDRNEYSVGRVGKILGILLHCVGGDPR